MGTKWLVAAVALSVLVWPMQTAHAYILQFESYDGEATAHAWGPGDSDFRAWPYQASANASGGDGNEWWWASCEAANTDLRSGGGVGEGVYCVGHGHTETYCDYGGACGEAQAATDGTYTWRLLSEYGNTGAVTVTLFSSGTEAGLSGDPVSAGVTVTSDLDSYTRSLVDWSDEITFDVLIGGTIIVECSTDSQSACDGGGDVTVDVKLGIPEEVPEPMTVSLLAMGAPLLLRRRFG